MTKLVGRVISVHAGSNEDLSKDRHASIQLEVEVYESPSWLARTPD